MVHLGLDYIPTWHCVLIAVGFDPWHPKYTYGYLKQWYNPKPSFIRLMLAILLGTQHAWYGRGSISNIFATCAFWAILCLFYCPLPHHTTNMANVPSFVVVYWLYAYMEGFGCRNYVQNPSFDVVAAYFWMVLLGMKIRYAGRNAMFAHVLEARIRLYKGSSLMGMGWMTGWYFGTPCWL